MSFLTLRNRISLQSARLAGSEPSSNAAVPDSPARNNSSPMLTLLRTLLGQPSARLVATASIFDDNRVLMVREGSAHKRGEWNLPS